MDDDRRAELEAKAEQAIRESVPWPNKMVVEDYDAEEWVEHEQTLQEFVSGTYIGPADEVFQAAAASVIKALIEAGDLA